MSEPIPIDKDRIPDGPMCLSILAKCPYMQYEDYPDGRIVSHRCLALPASIAPARDAEHQEKLKRCPKPQGEWP